MAKRREQRSADKQRRRAARKAQDQRRAGRAKASVQQVTRAADGMLDDETYARVGYDPLRLPGALDWLSLAETERMRAVEAYHRVLPRSKQPPNAKLHATIHVVIENQLAMGDPPEVAQALSRLMGEDLDRHTALHAIGSVLSGYLLAVMKGSESFDAAGYARDVAVLTRESWLASVKA